MLEQKKIKFNAFCGGKKKKLSRDGLPDLAAVGRFSLSDLPQMKQGLGEIQPTMELRE